MKPEVVNSTREALLAELIGDVQQLLGRVEGLGALLGRADASVQSTVASLVEANELYRTRTDDQLAKLRSELAGMMDRTAHQAARSIVGPQTALLQQAAVQAVRAALQLEFAQRWRTANWRAMAIGISGGLLGSLCAAALMRALDQICR